MKFAIEALSVPALWSLIVVGLTVGGNALTQHWSARHGD